MKRRWIGFALIAAPMLAAIAAGAFWGFPVFDDAYMLLFIREGHAAAIAADHPDRPLYGALLEGVARSFGATPAPYIAIGIGSWLLLAWQTSLLWRRLFPDRPELGLVAAALCFSPILVTIQFTTVTTTLPVTLPVVLCLAALLAVLGKTETARIPAELLAAGLAAAAALLSEYGIAAAAACVALLLGVGRIRSAAAFLAGTGCGYLAFRLISDVSVRPKVVPSLQVVSALDAPLRALSLWLSGLWFSLAGAWATTAGAIHVDSESKASWILLLAGALAATGCALWIRGTGTAERAAAPRVLRALLLAIAAGLLVVVMANSSPVDRDPYRSRYRLPIVPFAAVTVVYAVDRLVRFRLRVAAFVALAFLAAWRVADGAFETRREQQAMDEIGRQLLPLVRDSSGFVVGVVPDRDRLDASDMTPKITKRWADEDARRAWVLPLSTAAHRFGPRLECRTPEVLELPFEYHAVPKTGPLSRLVWLPDEGRGAAAEPYCLGSGK